MCHAIQFTHYTKYGNTVFHNTPLCSIFTPKDSANPPNNAVLIQDHAPRFCKDAYIINSLPMHTDFRYVTSHSKENACGIQNDTSQDDKLIWLTKLTLCCINFFFFPW